MATLSLPPMSNTPPHAYPPCCCNQAEHHLSPKSRRLRIKPEPKLKHFLNIFLYFIFYFDYLDFRKKLYDIIWKGKLFKMPIPNILLYGYCNNVIVCVGGVLSFHLLSLQHLCDHVCVWMNGFSFVKLPVGIPSFTEWIDTQTNLTMIHSDNSTVIIFVLALSILK